MSANGQLPDANGVGPTPVIIDPRVGCSRGARADACHVMGKQHSSTVAQGFQVFCQQEKGRWEDEHERAQAFKTVDCQLISSCAFPVALMVHPFCCQCLNAYSECCWSLPDVAMLPFLHVQGALDYAHRLTKVPGSSTAFVLQLDQKKNALVAANVVGWRACMSLGAHLLSRSSSGLRRTAVMCAAVALPLIPQLYPCRFPRCPSSGRQWLCADTPRPQQQQRRLHLGTLSPPAALL